MSRMHVLTADEVAELEEDLASAEVQVDRATRRLSEAEARVEQEHSPVAVRRVIAAREGLMSALTLQQALLIRLDRHQQEFLSDPGVAS